MEMFDKANFMEIGGETSSGGEKPQVEGRNLKWRGETSSGGEKP
jgi:hypothetical protein